MSLQNPIIENTCPRNELAAYVDGELSSREELELERHIAGCSICALELNEQKRLLSALDFVLEDEKNFKLPENFTRVVVANAESKVSGLRCPNERYRAGFVVAALILLFFVGLGGEVKTVSFAFLQIGEKVATVCSFALHLIFNVAIGASIILRSISSQFIYTSPFWAVTFIAVFFTALFALTRFINRFKHW